MNIPKDKMRFAYYYILKHQKGYIEELNAIHEDIAEYFHSMGLISCGIDALLMERFQITDYGKQEAALMYVALTHITLTAR